MAGKFSEITYEQVIASVKLLADLEGTSDYDGFISLMVDEAMRNIKDGSMFEIKTLELELVDGSVEVPCGFMYATGAWYLTSDGKCAPMPYVDKEVVNMCGCANEVFGTGGVTYQLNGSWLTINSPSINTDDYESMSLAFNSIRLNANNEPVIYERHERAVRAYALARVLNKLVRRQKERWRAIIMKQDAKDYMSEYRAQKKYIVANNLAERFEQDKKSLSRTFNAWITRNNMRGKF